MLMKITLVLWRKNRIFSELKTKRIYGITEANKTIINISDETSRINRIII